MKADKIKNTKPGGVCQSWCISGRKCTGTEICRQCGVVYRYKKGGQTDELTASIHYGEVSAFIDRYLKEHTFQLLEKVAESLAEELLLQTKGLQKIRLEIKNPGHRSVCR